MPTAAFDLLGTFFSTEPLRQRLCALGAPDHALELWWAESLRDALALTGAGATRPLEDVLAATLPRILAELGRPAQDPSRVELVLKGLRVLNPADGAADAAARLSASGWTLIGLTRGSEAHARALTERAGLRKQFAALIAADHLGTRHADPYALARQHAGGETWLVTTHAWDAIAARRAGLRTAWISRRERHWPATYPEPDLQVPDLAACVQVLERRGATLGAMHA
ncbi:MAG: hypothetical protein IRZ16_01100 [Myxococcaceae bacterium]|nr:hypothetical protein [Myxococcaceae bacterium]